MSLCSRCGHNSVFHVNGWCVGHLQDEPNERMSIRRIYGEKPTDCDCTLDRMDRAFHEHMGPRGELLPGHPHYRGTA